MFSIFCKINTTINCYEEENKHNNILTKPDEGIAFMKDYYVKKIKNNQKDYKIYHFFACYFILIICRLNGQNKNYFYNLHFFGNLEIVTIHQSYEPCFYKLQLQD